MFIRLIEKGNKSSIKLAEYGDESIFALYEDVLFNGFNIIYKILFTIAIFCDGKALKIEGLDKVSNLNLNRINDFLEKFKLIFTLNYDRIIENIIEKEIIHLHGSFILDKKEYVYSQSIGLEYNKNKYVSFSDIVIGDYFINKGFFEILIDLTDEKDWNKTSKSSGKIIEENIINNKINTIVLFGRNIENDENLVRDIIAAYDKADIKNPKIIYCFYNEEEKEYFESKYNDLNKFSKGLTDYGSKIERFYIDTKEILQSYFYKH